MRHAFIVDGDGAIVQALTAPYDEAFTNFPLAPGQSLVPFVGQEIDGFEPVQVDGVWTMQPKAVDTALLLAVAKARKRDRVNAIRDARQQGVADTALGPVNIDPFSKAKIDGLMQSALLAKIERTPFAETFTLADNRDAPVNAEQMIKIGAAVNNAIVARHEFAKALKKDIEAATKLAQLEAIDVETGWP